MADSAAQPRPQRPLKKVSEATRERETFRQVYPFHRKLVIDYFKVFLLK